MILLDIVSVKRARGLTAHVRNFLDKANAFFRIFLTRYRMLGHSMVLRVQNNRREVVMIGFKVGVTALGLVVGMLLGGPAIAWKRGAVDVLAVLPEATGSVEGLTVGPDGNIYVPTFGFNASGPLSGNAVLFVISPNGQLIRKVPIAHSSPHILGLAFNLFTKDKPLLVLDFGAGNVLKVDPATGNSSVFMTLPNPLPNPGPSGLNALTFDKSGNVYVSDSFQGVIWKTGPNGGTPSAWSSDSLLGPGKGLTPPFGANGIEFSNDGKVMYVANTAFHQIIQIPVNPDGTAGAASILITGINAPDGIAIDRDDNLWVCANQEDEIASLIKRGRLSLSLVISGASARMVSLVACYSQRAWLLATTARFFTSQI
jgi:sugar lactone lactonase YvrE